MLHVRLAGMWHPSRHTWNAYETIQRNGLKCLRHGNLVLEFYWHFDVAEDVAPPSIVILPPFRWHARHIIERFMLHFAPTIVQLCKICPWNDARCADERQRLYSWSFLANPSKNMLQEWPRHRNDDTPPPAHVRYQDDHTSPEHFPDRLLAVETQMYRQWRPPGSSQPCV